MTTDTVARTRILVVDPQPSLLAPLQVLLEDAGFELVLTHSALEAIEQTERCLKFLKKHDIRVLLHRSLHAEVVEHRARIRDDDAGIALARDQRIDHAGGVDAPAHERARAVEHREEFDGVEARTNVEASRTMRGRSTGARSTYTGVEVTRSS